MYRPRVAVTFITRATLTSTFAVRATCGLRYAYQPCVADRPPQKLSVAWRIEGPGPGQRSPTEWSGGQYSRGGLDWRPICVPPVPPVPPLPPGCDLSRNMSHTTCGHTNALWATRGHKHTHTRSVHLRVRPRVALTTSRPLTQACRLQTGRPGAPLAGLCHTWLACEAWLAS